MRCPLNLYVETKNCCWLTKLFVHSVHLFFEPFYDLAKLRTVPAPNFANSPTLNSYVSCSEWLSLFTILSLIQCHTYSSCRGRLVKAVNSTGGVAIYFYIYRYQRVMKSFAWMCDHFPLWYLGLLYC